MSLVVISVDRGKLPDCSDDEFEAWIKYNVGDSGSIRLDNPLAEYDMDGEVREISK